MTSRELVRAAIEFKNPDRVPRDFWCLPWAWARQPEWVKKVCDDFPSDFIGPDGSCTEAVPPTVGDAYDGGVFIDEWGCRFESVQPGYIGEVKHPQITDEDWDDADKVRFPVEWLTVKPEQVNAIAKSTDKWMQGGCNPRPFEQLQYLRGSENFYMDLLLQPPKMMAFLDKMHRFYCDLLHAWAHTDMDALTFMDDWGAQRSLLIQPDLWRDIFKPMYRDFARIAHSHGKKIFMHSDGNILQILPDLIEIGVDAINCQIFCMGLENLAPFAGKICFWGEMDRQHLLPYATPDEIEAAVRQVYKTLWRDGGCIAQLEFGPGAKGENVYRAYQTWDNILE